MSAHLKPVPSPCINVCQMDPASGWCSGCLRTLDEIAAWSTLDGPAKLAVWRRLPARRLEARRLRQARATPDNAASDTP